LLLPIRKERVMKKSNLGLASLVLTVLGFVFGLSSLTFAVGYDSQYDLFKDGRIDSQDLGILAEKWLLNCSSYDCEGADFDNSNKVDLADFALFANYWLTLELSAFDCDLVEDCRIDWKDLARFAESWLADCSVSDCGGSDLNKNGKVDFLDYSLLAQHWSADPNICLWEFIERQLANTMNELATNPIYSGGYDWPRATGSDGKWQPLAKGEWGHWACGFIPGSLWYLYQKTSDETWRNLAEDRTAQLEHNRYRDYDHESGFVIYRSYGLGYQITGNPDYIPVIMDATTYLLHRYNAAVGCIKSWNAIENPKFEVIIDGMMMLEMVFWASKNGGDPTWYDKAVSHADKTMQNNVRPNGSTWQIVEYNPTTGAVNRKWYKQGINQNTTWSRGQAWGICGFTIAYRETGESRFLETAKKIADYFIDHSPPDHVPYWDFNAPDYPQVPQVRDSSAAAIAASGLLELSTLVSSQQDKEKYYNAACNILDSLSSPAYLAHGTNNMAILLHGCAGGGAESSLMYGDHFFIEALLRRESIPPP